MTITENNQNSVFRAFSQSYTIGKDTRIVIVLRCAKVIDAFTIDDLVKMRLPFFRI